MPHLSTDVFVVGAGGAGMYAAIAAALGEQEPDHWHHHHADTLAAGPEP